MTLVEDIKLELEERLERANLSKEMLEDNKQETQVIVYNIKLYQRGLCTQEHTSAILFFVFTGLSAKPPDQFFL